VLLLENAGHAVTVLLPIKRTRVKRDLCMVS
jgi:hypothetical protein